MTTSKINLTFLSGKYSDCYARLLRMPLDSPTVKWKGKFIRKIRLPLQGREPTEVTWRVIWLWYGTDVTSIWHNAQQTTVAMSSSEDEDGLAWLNLMNAQHQTRRRFWVHPYWRENTHERGAYKIFKELNLYPQRFHSFYRISKSSFDLLVT
jgi:hypothetical protein